MSDEYFIINFCNLNDIDIEILYRRIKQMRIIDRIEFINKIIDAGDESICTHPNFITINNAFNQEILLGNGYINIIGNQEDREEVFKFLTEELKYKVINCTSDIFFIDIGNKRVSNTYEKIIKIIEIDKYKFFAIFDRGYKRKDTIKDLLDE